MEKSVLHFNGTWRTYQQRILDNLSLHLSDEKLHVVAAPGAGKTTLGLEIIARLNTPTLILTPTITIRDQWKQRLIDSFLNGQNAADIVSVNIRAPKFITVITYQALLAAFCGKDEEATDTPKEEEETTNEQVLSRLSPQKAQEIITLLKQAQISVLCFDEAHHLRKEWWKALAYLMEHLSPRQTVSLTATPPYDADGAEWQRYSELCGPIDEMISIPELVQNGDLCPHQDFIHFSRLRKTESDEIRARTARITEFLTSLLKNDTLIQTLYAYLEQQSVETILDEPKTHIALAAFLRHAGFAVPANFLTYFDIKENQIPTFSPDYQQLFLQFVFLKKDAFLTDGQEDFFAGLTQQAKEAGVLVRNSVFTIDDPKIKRTIANSLGKLDSIEEIVALEAKTLGKDLRLVVLADYIKYNVTDCSALGVIPIWQTLKKHKDISLGVLTGSIILVPSHLRPLLTERFNCLRVNLTPFERDENFLKVTASDSSRSALVKEITQLFNEGHLTVLVGTQALLGEGWDAPSINSLILSSTVSSYMLSNQMRGRAIRKDRNNPDKVSNIWHLASVKIMTDWEIIKQRLSTATATPDEDEALVQLHDYQQLCQRFQGYEAPGEDAPYTIENGIDRILPEFFKTKLNTLSAKVITEDLFIGLNKGMMSRAANREKTRWLWQEGFVKRYNNAELSLRKGVRHTGKISGFSYRGYFSIATIWAMIFGLSSLPLLRTEPVITLLLLGAFFVIMIKPTWYYLRCSSPEKIIRQIAIVTVETLAAMKQIKANLQRINIRCETCPLDKSIFVSVGNVSPEENNLIMKSIREILDPIQNPRYLLVRKEFFGIWPTQDFFAVPSVISQKKEHAQIFYQLWKKYISECDLIFTRTPEGRKQLLYARSHAFSSLFRKSQSKQVSRYE
ncbi:DEAD/DEAH box helicase family protein [Candidatus Avelusimicrobium luingense]|uniref:DEAD/DEAH box helicase family protein n=1 Tax=Candidatus Avelusimicrobium luingense TaxID=3416211 RepID=UPI003D0A9F28